MGNKNVYNKSEDFILRKIENETYLIPLKYVSEEEPLYGLNKTGLIIYEKIDGKKTIEKITDEVSQKNGCECPKGYVEGFLSELEKEGIVNKV